MFTNVSRPSAVDVLRPFVVGDTFYADTTSTLAKLPIGSTDDVLIVSGGVPVWSSTVVIASLSVVDSGFFVIGNVDPTKRLTFEVDAQTTGDTLTISTGAQTDSRTLSVPVLAGADTIATLAVANAFTGNNTMAGTLELTTASNGLTVSKTTGTTLTVSSTDATAAISSAGCVRALSYRFSTGNRFAVVSGSYHQIYSQADGAALLLGGSGDPANYYNNTSHIFRSIAGTTFVTLSTATGAATIASGTQAAAGTSLTVTRTSTNTSGNGWGSLAVVTANPASASSANQSGLAGNVTIASGASGISGSIVGLDGAIDADATTNTFASCVALRGTLRKGGANTLTVATAVEAALSASAAGSIGSAHGLYVSSMANSGGATITTAYGLRITSISVGTTNYAIHTGTGLVSFGDEVLTTASTTTRAGLNLPHGSAPSAPVDGDMWTTTAGLFVRINGVTVGPLS